MIFSSRIIPYAIILTSTSPAYAQHAHTDHMAQDQILTLPATRGASGTSWMPDESPMYGIHATYGEWQLMFHANLFIQSIHEENSRVDDQVGSINWAMVMAATEAAAGTLNLRLMLSAEPWTVGKCGYPDILQTGETCNGKALYDRQHPHDLFMEVAASYQKPLNQSLGFELYGGPVAEPALGPVAFPHRLSAFPGPQGPISHHWLDSTHISFGVLTAGLFTSQWKAEASVFNGREPDENRTDWDLDSMDSYSGRISFLPSPRWALQVSGGYLKDAEMHGADEPFDVRRYIASIMYHQTLPGNGVWATTLAQGENHEGGEASPASLLESSLNLMNRHILSSRVERVEKSGHDLALEGAELEHRKFTLTKISAGYLHQFPALQYWTPGLGATASIGYLPSALKKVYKDNNPMEFVVFASLRPGPMEMGPHENMHHGESMNESIR